MIITAGAVMLIYSLLLRLQRSDQMFTLRCHVNCQTMTRYVNVS